MKRLLLLVLLLSSPMVMAVDYYSANELALNVTVSNSLRVVPTGKDYSLKKATVFLSYFPKEDYRQEVNSITTRPEAEELGDDYIFVWKNPIEDEISFSLKSSLTTKNSLIKVYDQVDFPISYLSPDLRVYTEATPTIDYNDVRIRNLASQLASGEDDLYVVVTKLGTWVNKNINYNLNTQTADVSQKASWVIENKEGVCDELTNLFIGLCRSLGIPARFVSGMSYSNTDLFVDRWSPHGWAEVYFPNYGWVPFDVTYGELGFIDPTHIKLKDSLDANKSSTKYEWEGYNVDLKTEKITIKTNVVSAEGRWTPLLGVDEYALRPNAGFGSYDAVVVEIKNPHEYYVPTELFLSKSEGIQTFDDYSRFVLMKPYETKKEYWIVKLDSQLRKNYIYNFTIKAYSIRNASDTTNIVSSGEFKVYSLQDIRDQIDQSKEEETKTYSRNLDIQCSSGDIFYAGEIVRINCTLSNRGNVPLKGLSVCLEDDCRDLDLYISEKKAVEFDMAFNAPGPQDLVIVARNINVTKTADVQFVVWDRPRVMIEDLRYPESTRLADNFTIGFRLSPKTASIPEDVKVRLSGMSFEKEWTIDRLDRDSKYVLNVGGDSLAEEDNRFTLSVSYSDDLGRQYSENVDFTIGLMDVTLRDKATMFLNSLGRDAKNDVIVLSLSIFFAAIVVGLIFRTRKRRDG